MCLKAIVLYFTGFPLYCVAYSSKTLARALFIWTLNSYFRDICNLEYVMGTYLILEIFHAFGQGRAVGFIHSRFLCFGHIF